MTSWHIQICLATSLFQLAIMNTLPLSHDNSTLVLTGNAHALIHLLYILIAWCAQWNVGQMI